MTDTYQDNYARLSALALEQGLNLNPDEERVQKVVGLMAVNYDLTKEWICPCKQTVKPAEKGKDKLCPCPEWIDEINEQGHCFCKLFYAK